MLLDDYLQPGETVHYRTDASPAIAVTDSRLVAVQESSGSDSVVDIALDRIDQIQYRFQDRHWWYIGAGKSVLVLWLTLMIIGDEIDAIQPLPTKVAVTILPLALALMLLYYGWQQYEELVVVTPSGSLSFTGDDLEPVAHAIRGAAP